ncbi:MAG: two-component regulator propeller domain-containing protein [Bacteroidales bacterium]|nr:two-component regulator propeller domain-containing protein [Bacteroidales bacterium]
MHRSVLYLFLFLQGVFSALHGQSSSKWIPLNISNQDGLSNSAITCIYQDSEGLMWFGSWDGLNRYDGTNITVFKPDAYDHTSISNNIIKEILEDRNHNLWILTNKDINRLRSNTVSFESYFSGNGYLPVREMNIRACIGPDSLLYVSLMGYGLTVYEESSNSFQQLSLPGMNDAGIKDIIGLSAGTSENFYFLGSEGKLSAYTKSARFTLKYEEDLGKYKDLVFESHWFLEDESTTYLAIAMASGGLFFMDLENKEFSRIGEHDENFMVTTLNQSLDDDMYWLGTDDGSVYRLSMKGEPRLTPMDENMTDLSSNEVKIWTIQQTSNDLLWIGTDGNGVFRYITKGKPFFNIKKGAGEYGTLGHNIVRALYQDANENLWVGTRGDGLNMIRAGNGRRITYNTRNGLSNNAVLALNMDSRNNLWIGINGEGIDMLETSSGNLFHFPEDFVNGSDTDFGYVYSICMDIYGSMWLGTSGYGLVNMEVSKDSRGRYVLERYKQFRYNREAGGVNSDIIYAIVEERPNVLWIGTRGGGLHRMNSLNNTFEVYGVRNKSDQEIIDDDILSLCMGRDQKLWIGTSEGLSVLNLSYRPYQFQHYSERNGMPNNTVHSIVEDAKGDIWMSTNHGLSQFVVAEGNFLNYNKSDGLQNSEYTDGAFFNNTRTQIVYFGGVEGIDWFNPPDIEPSTNFPPVYLDEFRLNNTVVIPEDSTMILSTSLNKAEEIDLKYNQNFFSISFTTLNYYNSQKCQFSYYLKGYSNGWVDAGSMRLAIFTNVPPGKYMLQVKASNEDGIYGNEVRTLPIVIHPPFWNTWAAYIFYSLLFATLIFMVIRLIRRRINERREVELARIEREKSDEINRYKLQFFTDIAHEFRTPLTLIMAPAAVLEEKLIEKHRLGLYARSIYQNASRLQKLISELIEFRKVETNNMKLSLGRYDLVNYISKLTKEFEVFDHLHEVTLTFSHTSDAFEAWIDPEKFEKIVLNLVSNAIKYTPAGGSVEIELRHDPSDFYLLVRDTGVGIPGDLLDKIFDRFYHHGNSRHDSLRFHEGGGVGLSLTRGLVELHNGTISARNLPGGGSEFCVKLPILQHEAGADAGDTLHNVSSEKIAIRVAEEFHTLQLHEKKEPEFTSSQGENREYALLVVDDNKEVCQMVESLLLDTYLIHKAYDGEEALEILDREAIDLVISDIMMNQMDGFELTRKIKEDIQTSHIPVILLTAKTEIESRIEGLEIGADAYIPKPFHPRHLVIMVEKLIAAREQLRKILRTFATDQDTGDLPEGLTSHDQDLIRRLTEYIEENIEDSNLNADILAGHIAMSKTQLYRKIKALTGLTPHGLINNLRLKKAAAALLNSEKTVSEIYYETGFNSRSYFYQTFKESYGVSPGDYKEVVNGS